MSLWSRVKNKVTSTALGLLSFTGVVTTSTTVNAAPTDATKIETTHFDNSTSGNLVPTASTFSLESPKTVNASSPITPAEAIGAINLVDKSASMKPGKWFTVRYDKSQATKENPLIVTWDSQKDGKLTIHKSNGYLYLQGKKVLGFNPRKSTGSHVYAISKADLAAGKAPVAISGAALKAEKESLLASYENEELPKISDPQQGIFHKLPRITAKKGTYDYARQKNDQQGKLHHTFMHLGEVLDGYDSQNLKLDWMVALKESSLDPYAINRYGYGGLFQFGITGKSDKTLIKNAGFMDDDGTWRGKYGIKSAQEFLEHPFAQFETMHISMQTNIADLENIIEKHNASIERAHEKGHTTWKQPIEYDKENDTVIFKDHQRKDRKESMTKLGLQSHFLGLNESYRLITGRSPRRTKDGNGLTAKQYLKPFEGADIRSYAGDTNIGKQITKLEQQRAEQRIAAYNSAIELAERKATSEERVENAYESPLLDKTVIKPVTYSNDTKAEASDEMTPADVEKAIETARKISRNEFFKGAIIEKSETKETAQSFVKAEDEKRKISGLSGKKRNYTKGEKQAEEIAEFDKYKPKSPYRFDNKGSFASQLNASRRHVGHLGSSHRR